MLFEEVEITKFFIRAIGKEGLISSEPDVYIKKNNTQAMNLANGKTVRIKKTEFVYVLHFSKSN